jgi:integrative and conjugative element protein (TIGR02256 family)
MKILLAPPVVKRLRRELRSAGNREIGGLLMGEDLGNGDFKVVEISVQRSGGTEACFIRKPKDHQTELDTFFARTGNDYSRFNYLGEWHSHPSFTSNPSMPDLATMLAIVNDPAAGSNFLVLLIARLAGKQVEATATLFTKTDCPVLLPLEAEVEPRKGRRNRLSGWFKKIFRA